FEATYAASALAALTGRAPRPEVYQLLEHENPQIRLMAVQVLATCGDASAVGPLRQLLESAADQPAPDGEGGSEQLTMMVAQALGQIGGSAARQALEAAWTAAAGNVKASLSLCLAALDHPGGLKAAVHLAQAGAPQMRIAAVSALGFSRSSVAFHA